MSQFKVSFTLKQHTPIIHFQSDQSGATLRATELKPKLDRFLLEKVKMLDDESKPKDEYRSWFIGDGKKHLALDYSIQILYNGENNEDNPTPSKTPYFAGGVSIEHEQDVDIKLIIKSFNLPILTEIENSIALFFTFENFGTRQSKGFGSYHLEETTNEDFEFLLKKHKNPTFQLTKNMSSHKEVFKQIDLFYKYLKMGQRRPYDRSLLFQFMCKEYKIGWEKKFLKIKYPEIIHGTHTPIVCKEPKEYRYIRAVLGLAEHNEYRPRDGKKQIKISSVKRDLKDKRKPLYQRFKSPITFKVFNHHIYLIYDKSYEAILDEEFYFKLNGKSETLSTPKDFDMYKFLKFVETKVFYFKELKCDT